MASGRDNASETFKLQIFKAISTLRERRKRPDGKAIQEYMNNNGAGNINESFVLDSPCPKNITVTQDASTNTSKPVTVTQDASNSASNCVDNGTDGYFELVLKSLRDHIVSLENQLRDKK